MYPKTIEGVFVTLQEITAEDAADIVRWRSDPRIYTWLFDARPLTLAQHMQWFLHTYPAQPHRVDYMMIHKESGRKIGVAGLKNLNGVPEISYMVGEADMAGKGCAKDAIRALLGYAKQAGYAAVEAHIVQQNTASVRLVESLGFCRTQSTNEGGRPSGVYTIAL